MHLQFRLTSFVLALLCASTVAYSQQATFARVRVTNGPTLEYPAYWKIADEATVQNRVHAGQAMADAAGVNLSGFQKRNRVVVESTPFPNTAQIRASIVKPQEYSQEDLRLATPQDLQALRAVFESTFRKLSASGTVKVDKVGEPRVERIAGKLALVIPYTRYTESDRVLWQVEQIKILFEDRLLSMNFSYRTSDTTAMKPILERVKRTLQF